MAKQSPQPQPRRPERKFRIGGSITAAVWANESNGRTFRTVDLQRSYKVGEEYQTNSTFTLADLPNAIRVLELALRHVEEQEADVTAS